jgi:hypothetical protein
MCVAWVVVVGGLDSQNYVGASAEVATLPGTCLCEWMFRRVDGWLDTAVGDG